MQIPWQGPLRVQAVAVTEPLAAGITVLWEDTHLLVLHKPSGLLSVPGRGPDKQDCLSQRVQTRYSEALVVHRLDMATSGLLLMARSPHVQRALGAAFAERRVHKRYTAVVQGLLPVSVEWHTIDLPIVVDWERRPLRIIDPTRGQPSITQWRSLGSGPVPDSTRLELSPITGRSHQLRVHLQALGHPILGDTLYADAATCARAPRLWLHAHTLALEHPVTGEPLEFTCAAPF